MRWACVQESTVHLTPQGLTASSITGLVKLENTLVMQRVFWVGPAGDKRQAHLQVTEQQDARLNYIVYALLRVIFFFN